jgi:spoIIIJ-associated protein
MASLEEFEGKNVQKAVEAACEALKISKENLKYKVISHGSTGIFGLVGIKKAKIKVTLNHEVPKAPIVPEDQTLAIHADLEGLPDITQEPQSETVDVAVDPENAEVHQAIDTGTDALRYITNAITRDTSISVERNDDRILYNVEGGNAALLIGKRGQTLEAIQYLVEKIVNKRNHTRVRVQVDVERYLEKRRTNLQELALRMAEKSKKTGKPSTIGQMNAYDRRIVHLTLKADKNVRTKSVGDGYIRKLVIFPKKVTRRSKRG